jgi:hypothetical protein
MKSRIVKIHQTVDMGSEFHRQIERMHKGKAYLALRRSSIANWAVALTAGPWQASGRTSLLLHGARCGKDVSDTGGEAGELLDEIERVLDELIKVRFEREAERMCQQVASKLNNATQKQFLKAIE